VCVSQLPAKRFRGSMRRVLVLRFPRTLVLAAALVCSACGSEDDPEPEPVRDAGRDAGRDASREAGRDSGVAEEEDASSEQPDAGSDPGEADAGDSDACVPFAMPTGVDCSAPSDGVLPRDLRCTGLYGNPEQKQVACGLLEYTPAYVLWSDDAEKHRYASIPAGKKIDVSDPDTFVFPDGTKFWKEFRVKGADGLVRLAETRLLQKSPDGWLYTSYVWNAAQTEAVQMNNMTGVPKQDVGGTSHTVPTRDQCNECHGGRGDQILGFDALMLGPGALGITRDKLVELDLVSGDIPALAIPGNELEKAALGYLHANCGISCHNENPSSKGFDSGLFLKLEKGELATVSATDAFRSAFPEKETGVLGFKSPSPNAKLDGLPSIDRAWIAVRPGDPGRSLLVARQRLRGVDGQMPRIGTNFVDETGVSTVADWIAAMTTVGGYPAAKP
jgi:hypothetical protein